MPATIVITKLSWRTPHHDALLTDLDLSLAAERTGLVGRNGVGKTTLLRLIAGELTAASGGVSITGSVGMLRQSVQEKAGDCIADLFGAREALQLLEKAAAGIASATELAAIDWTLEAQIEAALRRLGLDKPPATPLVELSGGERTRARLAALVFASPDFLLLDEPTNNLDVSGRGALIAFLAGWNRGALVVSHDRDLLETMDSIVELTSLGAASFGGGWSAYLSQKETALAAARHDLAEAEKQVGETVRASQIRSEHQARRDRMGRREKARGGIPRILVGARKDRSEATAGANARLSESRLGDAMARAEEARRRIEVLEPFSVDVASAGLPARKSILRLEQVTAGYDKARPILSDIDLEIVGPERVAVLGPNGAGKTSLIRLITGDLAPWQGVVRVDVDWALLDQQVSLLNEEASIRDNFRHLNPEADENHCRAVLARFMFRGAAALQQVGALSGGQRLRAGLACVLGARTPPGLIILDEPTNHLDLDSIAALEAGLSAYDGALLVVSHDAHFLRNIGVTRRFTLPGAGAMDGLNG